VSAYSLDLRKRVVQAALSGLSGMSRREVVATFSVSLATLKRWLVLHEYGSLSPKPLPGRRRRVGAEAEVLLRAQLQAHPDATLDEHMKLWQKEQAPSLGRATMARAILRVGYTRKKRA
jgi:transposase